jgi:hypothetical protein
MIQGIFLDIFPLLGCLGAGLGDEPWFQIPGSHLSSAFPSLYETGEMIDLAKLQFLA